MPRPPHGADAACTALLGRVPRTLEGNARRASHVPGVAVWGEPPAVLSCGVDPPAPTTLPCVSVNGVDWVVVSSRPSRSGSTSSGGDLLTVLVTYGRVPAVQFVVPAGGPAASAPLVDLAPAVSAIPQRRTCD